MNQTIKIITIFLITLVSVENLHAQSELEKTYSYGIWIREFQRGWIDSENSYWLIETPKKFEKIEPKLMDISFLERPLEIEAEHCCQDEQYKDNKKDLIFTGEIWDIQDFFSGKRTVKIKVGTKTLRIIALEQSNCKCSSDFITGGSSFGKTASIFNYKFLKLTRKEKKHFRTNKLDLIRFLEQQAE